MNSSVRWAFGFCVAASLIMVAVALHLWGAAEVRANASDVFFLTFVGAVWLVLATKLFSWLGLSFRDDAVERRNIAALTALCGAVPAVALTYIGGSQGEGPSYWNNVFSASLGTVGLLGVWILLELGAKVSVSIAEERDFASGLRMCGFLLAIGLVLGRAADYFRLYFTSRWRPRGCGISAHGKECPDDNLDNDRMQFIRIL